MTTDKRPILIIDSANLFIRCYTVFPQMSSVSGQQVGGIVGFLKTLRKLAADVQPSAVYIVWESGGSPRRRALYKEYKMNRRPERLNRFYGEDIPDTDDNRQHQIKVLLGLLKNVPVCQLYVPDCEGDDVIAYLCRGRFKDVDKVIASSDKDLYQLLDARTKQYSLHKKTFVTPTDVFAEFRVTANNFALAKTLCGDTSDNIPGIKGLGFKKVAKLFPFLGLDRTVLLQDVFDYSSSHIEQHAIYRRVVEQKNDIDRNWKLVFLNECTLAPNQLQRVDHAIDSFEPRARKIELIRGLIDEGISDLDVDGLFYALNCVAGLTYASAKT